MNKRNGTKPSDSPVMTVGLATITALEFVESEMRRLNNLRLAILQEAGVPEGSWAILKDGRVVPAPSQGMPSLVMPNA